jgi:hypothetical protein
MDIMASLFVPIWLKRLVHPSRRGGIRKPRRRPRSAIPRLEQLEDRTVPTIVFKNQFGTEQLLPQGGSTLSSPHVYLIFWGSYWEMNSGPQQQQLIISAAQTLFNSAYFTGQVQYGTDGTVLYGGFDNHTSDPPPSFSSDDITNTLHNDIDTGMVPDSQNTGDDLYVLITPPGAISAQGPNVGGYNAYSFQFDHSILPPDFTLDNYVYCWVGGGTNPNTFSVDTYSYFLSHELTEAITDPQSFRPFPNIGYNGYRVNPGANFQNPPPNSNQIADYEAQSYTYHLDDVQVQSYWSDADKNFVIPDGNLQNFLVNNGALTVTGDQFGSPYNDSISISTNAQGGVFVDENGETVGFDKGAITSINVNTGNGNDTVYVYKTLANIPVTIQLGNGQDNVFVQPVSGLQDIQGAVTVNGGLGTSTLTVDDSGNSASANWTVTDSSISRPGSPAITYHNLQNVTVNGGSGQTAFEVKSTAAGAASIISTGDSPFDGVNVEATTGPLTVNDGVGSSDTTVISQTPEDLDGIQGLVTVNGQGNSDELFVDDRLNGNPATWTVSGNNVTRISGAGGGVIGTGVPSIAVIDYSAIHQLNLYGGTGGSAFDLSPSLHNLDELPVSTIIYGSNGATNKLAAEDGNSPFNSTWIVTDDLVTRSYSNPGSPPHTAAFEYHFFQTLVLNGGSGANLYNVWSTDSITTTQINTGTGNDIINVGGGNAKLLDPIQGPVNVTGQGGTDTLYLNDQDSTIAHTFALTASSVGRDNAATIGFAGMAGVVVNGGSGGDTFNVTGISEAAPFTINGGAGDDSVNLNNPDLSDNPNLIHQLVFNGGGGYDTLSLNDQNAAADGLFTLASGSLTNANAPLLTLNFDTTLEKLNVNTGSGNDTFVILNSPIAPAVAINGGGGVNTLDYAAYTGDINVNLQLGVATALSGGISNIQDVFGSIGNDLLVGNAAAQVLSGGAGRNIIIAGAGNAHVIGGGGDNLLIGGITDYDQNLAALNDFMTEWLRTDLSFFERAADIFTGGATVPTSKPASVLKGTGFKLNWATVHDNKTVNILTGGNGNGHDWFFFDPFDDSVQNKKNGDLYIPIF